LPLQTSKIIHDPNLKQIFREFDDLAVKQQTKSSFRKLPTYVGLKTENFDARRDVSPVN
jgi:hypothetical protein